MGAVKAGEQLQLSLAEPAAIDCGGPLGAPLPVVDFVLVQEL